MRSRSWRRGGGGSARSPSERRRGRHAAGWLCLPACGAAAVAPQQRPWRWEGRTWLSSPSPTTPDLLSPLPTARPLPRPARQGHGPAGPRLHRAAREPPVRCEEEAGARWAAAGSGPAPARTCRCRRGSAACHRLPGPHRLPGLLTARPLACCLHPPARRGGAAAAEPAARAARAEPRGHAPPAGAAGTGRPGALPAGAEVGKGVHRLPHCCRRRCCWCAAAAVDATWAQRCTCLSAPMACRRWRRRRRRGRRRGGRAGAERPGARLALPCPCLVPCRATLLLSPYLSALASRFQREGASTAGRLHVHHADAAGIRGSVGGPVVVDGLAQLGGAGRTPFPAALQRAAQHATQLVIQQRQREARQGGAGQSQLAEHAGEHGGRRRGTAAPPRRPGRRRAPGWSARKRGTRSKTAAAQTRRPPE